jgi:pantoate--beta-alanine ligase
MFQPPNKVGFVPTMGALHEGHLSLVRHALKENTHVFVSIFVNPTQFGVNEDLDSYPKTWEEDLHKLQQVQDEYLASSGSGNDSRIQGIFAPNVKTMYPTLPPSSELDGEGSFVTITPLGKWLEGASRPVFFRGVATVCMKLFNIVQPDRVYFGQKDVQQSVLIKRMVKDFHIPTQVRVIPTSREADGLAMSSRNVHLGDRRRKDVSVLSRALLAAQDAYEGGETSAGAIRGTAFNVFDSTIKRQNGSHGNACRLEIDYIALSRPDDMSKMEDSEQINSAEGAILSAAMKVYPVDKPQDKAERNQISVRLIDNVILEPR